MQNLHSSPTRQRGNHLLVGRQRRLVCLAGEYLNLLTGLKMRHVPYKDVPVALGDVAAQRVSMMISNLPPAMALVRAGKLRPLAVTTRNRSKLLPDVPTMAEAGVAFEQTVWFALFARRTRQAHRRTRLNREVAQVLADAFKEKDRCIRRRAQRDDARRAPVRPAPKWP